MQANEADEARGELVRLLNEARQRHHLSVRGAAAVAGVPTATVQGWLSGKHLPTPALRESFGRLVEYLGLTDEISDAWWVDSRYLRTPHRDEDAPYLGLRPYTSADAPLFFGRERATVELAAAVARAATGPAPRLVILVGPSGSGKSSLLAAGLSLALGPGQPLEGFRWHSTRDGNVDEAEAATWSPSDIVVLDQLEDAFGWPALERVALFARVRTLAQQATVVLGLRADAFAQASLEPVLADALSRPVLLTPLNGAEFREAVISPALSRQVRVDEDLVTVLMGELAPGPETAAIPAGVLPLVSTALLVTWAAGSGDRMTLEDYRSTGGVASAVDRQAEGVYGSLDPDRRQVAERLFLRLVTVEADSVGRSTLALASLDAATREVVDAFTDARILTLTDGDVRISHEALLRHWSRLVGWIEESRGDLFVLEQLKRAAQLWVDNGRDPESLIPLKRLPMFQELMAEQVGGPLLTVDERDFVAASTEHFASVLEKEKTTSATLRRRGRLATGLAVVAGTLALATTMMFSQAQSATRVAETAELAAQSRQAGLAAQQVAAQDPNLQRRLALVADSLSSTREARSALGDATAVYAPTRWAGEGRSRLAVSPDGELVVRAGVGAVTLWRGAELDSSPGTTVALDPEGGAITGVSLAQAAGRTLLALSGDHVAGLWDVTGAPTLLRSLEGGGWTAAELSPDGRRAGFGHGDGRIQLVDLANPGHPSPGPVLRPGQEGAADSVAVRSLLFHGNTLYAGGRGYTIWRWTLGGDEPRQLASLSYGSERVVLDLAISPEGDQLAAGTYGRKLFRWRVGSGEPTPMKTLTPFVSNVLGVAFTRDGRGLLAAGDDHRTYVFDAATGELRTKLPGPNPVQSVGEVADGRTVTVDAAGDLRVWPRLSPVLRTGNSGYCFASDPSGRWLALGTAFDGVNLWDTRDGGFRRMPDPPVTFPDAPGEIRELMAAGVGIDPKGRFLLGGTTEGHIVRWPLTDAGAGEPQILESMPGQYVGFIAISRDGSLVAASAVNSGTLVVLYTVDEAGNLTKAASIPAHTPEAVAISADGSLLAFPNVANEVELWSLADPRAPARVGSVPTDAQPVIVTFSPVAPTLGIGTMSGEVSLWNVADAAAPAVVSRYRDARSEVYGLTFSPDGRTVLGSGGDERVFQWDATVPNSPAVAAYNGQFGRTNDVAFAHGGSEFVATGDNGEVRSFVFDRDAARRYLCRTQGTPLGTDEWARYLTGIPQRDPCEGLR